MDSKIVLLFFMVLAWVSLGTSQSLDSPAWQDTPSYFQDSSVDVRFSDVIEKNKSYQKCTNYNETSLECLSYTTDYRGGQNTYIFGIENIDYWYIGNGNVHLEFDVVRNDLTKELKNSQNNPVKEQQFIDWFNGRYLFNDKNIDSTSYDSLLGYTEDIGVSSLGDSLKAKNLESKNLMAQSNSRIETVIKLEDFRNGGAKINDAVTVEVVS